MGEFDRRVTELRERRERIAAALKARMELLGWSEVRYWQDADLAAAEKHATWHAAGTSPADETWSTEPQDPHFGPDGALYRIYGDALEVAEEGVA